MSSLSKNENNENDNNNSPINNKIKNVEIQTNLDNSKNAFFSDFIYNQNSRTTPKKILNDYLNESSKQLDQLNNLQDLSKNNSLYKEKKNSDDSPPSSLKNTQSLKNNSSSKKYSLSRSKRSSFYTIDLKNKLKELDSKIQNETKINLEETNNLNNELSAKSSELKLVINEHYNLIGKLKKFKNDLDSQINISKLISMQKKTKLILLKEAQLKKLLLVKDKEILNALKMNEIALHEYKKVKKLNENNSEDTLTELQKEFFLLKSEIKELEYDIKKLNAILNEHKYCINHKNKLLYQLELYKKLYQFEIKNSILIENKINSNNNKNDKKNKVKNSFKKNLSSDYLMFSKRITSAKKKDKYKKLLSNKIIKDYVNNFITSMNSEKNENYCSKDYINKSNDNNKINILFNSNENFYLNKIIPNSILEIYKKRFDSLEVERREIKTIIGSDQLKHKKKLLLDKNKIELFRLRNKELKKEQINLNFEQRKQKLKILDIKRKINKVNKESQKYKKMMIIREKESQKLKEKIAGFLKMEEGDKKQIEYKEENHNFIVISKKKNNNNE